MVLTYLDQLLFLSHIIHQIEKKVEFVLLLEWLSCTLKEVKVVLLVKKTPFSDRNLQKYTTFQLLSSPYSVIVTTIPCVKPSATAQRKFGWTRDARRLINVHWQVKSNNSFLKKQLIYTNTFNNCYDKWACMKNIKK